MTYNTISRDYRGNSRILTSTTLESFTSSLFLWCMDLADAGVIGRHYHSETHLSISPGSISRIFRADTFQSPEGYSSIRDDFIPLSTIVHPGLAAYTGITFDTSQTTVQRRLVNGVSLSDRLAERLPLSDALSVCINIGEAIQYLHNQNIVACAIRAENVIISSTDQRAILVDYGIRAILLDTTEHPQQPIHYAHIGPEGINGPRGLQPTKQLDIYNFGLLLFLVFNGRTPWVKCNLPNMLRDMTKGVIQSDPMLPWAVNDLIMRMLAPDPESRPTIDVVIRSLLDMRASLPAKKEGSPGAKIPFRKFGSTRDFAQVVAGLKSAKNFPVCRSSIHTVGSFNGQMPAAAKALPRLQPSRSARKSSLTPGKPLRPLSGTLDPSSVVLGDRSEGY